jgi:predicted phosphodiesterase
VQQEKIEDSNVSNLEENNSYHYLFLGHTYDSDPIIDKRISKDKLFHYDQLWLGGDLTSETSDLEKLRYLDSVFDLKGKNTHWAFGNHDIREGRKRVIDYIEKPEFYAVYINGITLLIYDSNYYDTWDCENSTRQTEYIYSVCDTISKSSHLVLMSHHASFGEVEDIDVWTKANTSIESRLLECDSNTTFKTGLYPLLTDVQSRGIQVITLAGDFGQQQSSFEYLTKDGIYFLGSGTLSSNEYNKTFNKTNDNDSILIFHHQPKEEKLSWKFVDIGNY